MAYRDRFYLKLHCMINFVLWAFILATSSFCEDSGWIPVKVEYFYSPGCPDCQRIQKNILPQIEDYADQIRLETFDINIKSNFLKLVAYQNTHKSFNNTTVSMVVDETHLFDSYSTIQNELIARIDQQIALRLDGVIADSFSHSDHSIEDESKLIERSAAFTVGAVAVCGLVDGLNPCSFAMLVFFMSLLCIQGGESRQSLFLGFGYALGAFMSYMAIGFGLMKGLHAMQVFPRAQVGFEMGIGVLLIGLSLWSFRDACLYHRSRNAEKVALQLPDRLKRYSRALLKRGLRSRHLFFGGVIAGAGVTSLEAVCTGQVYVPTLALIINLGQGGMRQWGLLLLYNAMFLVPLFVLFGLIRYGMKVPGLIRLSKSNVVLGKLTMGGILLIMGMYFLLVSVLRMVA